MFNIYKLKNQQIDCAGQVLFPASRVVTFVHFGITSTIEELRIKLNTPWCFGSRSRPSFTNRSRWKYLSLRNLIDAFEAFPAIDTATLFMDLLFLALRIKMNADFKRAMKWATVIPGYECNLIWLMKSVIMKGRRQKTHKPYLELLYARRWTSTSLH